MGTEKKQPAFPQEALPNGAFSSHQTSSDKKTMAGLSNNMPPAKTVMKESAKGSADSVTQTPQTAEKQPPFSAPEQNMLLFCKKRRWCFCWHCCAVHCGAVHFPVSNSDMHGCTSHKMMRRLSCCLPDFVLC